MEYVAITTHSNLTLDAIRLLGFTTKANDDSKIGQFGSGIKYAIAAALRNDIPLFITANDEVYYFTTKTKIVQDHQVDIVVCYRFQNIEQFNDFLNNPTSDFLNNINDINNSNVEIIDLGFTTDFGQHDWKSHTVRQFLFPVEWLIFREFLANAIDEDTYSIKIIEQPNIENNNTKSINPNNINQTTVHIGMNSNMKYVMDNKNLFYLEDVPETKMSIVGEGGFIYNKGLVVTKTDTYFNYNFQNIKLTESRTLTVSNFCMEFCRGLSYLSDHDFSKLCNMLITNCTNPDTHYSEYDIYNYVIETQTIGHRLSKLYDGHFFAPPEIEPSLYDRLVNDYTNCIFIPRKWYQALASVIPNYRDYLSFDILNDLQLVQTPNWSFIPNVNEAIKQLCDIELPTIRWFHNPKTKDYGYFRNNTIYINIDLCQGEREYFQTLLEECIHMISGASDYTRRFVDSCLGLLFTKYYYPKQYDRDYLNFDSQND